MNNLSLGIIFGLIALVTNGIASFLAKVPAKAIGANKLILYRNISNTILLAIILFFTLDQATFSLKYMIIALLLSFFGYIPMYYFYRAAAIGKMGVVSPVASANALVATILALTIFGEKLTNLQTISIVIIISGIILISINFREFKSSHIFSVSSGVPYALIAALGWGIWSVLVKFPASHLGPYLTSLIIEGGSMVVAFYLVLKNKEILALKNQKMLKYIIPISVLMVIWSLAFYQGIRVANVSIVITLSSASPLIVTLLGRIFYHEKLEIKQYFAIAMIISGIILISV